MAAARQIRLDVVRAQRRGGSDTVVRKTGDILTRMLASAQVSGSPDDKSDENLQSSSSSPPPPL
jgi:hypothetical protein